MSEGSTRTGDRVVTVTDCGIDTGGSGLAAHIAIVFVVLVISAAGFLFPAIMEFLSSSSPKEGDGAPDHNGHHHHHHPVPKRGRRHAVLRALFAACNFAATGVLLNIGFIHILSDAGDHLSSPCLPDSFAAAFPDWAVLTASAAVMAMMLLDHLTLRAVAWFAARERDRAASSALAAEAGAGGGGLEPAASGWDRAGTTSVLNRTVSVAASQVAGGGGCQHPLPTEGSEGYRRAVVVLVEASVCVHSVPVGVALGMQKGDGFLTLAIAVCIHQFLEGFAVGAAVLKARYSTRAVAVSALLFSLTAPVGIAVGAGLRSVLNPNSASYLLTIGFVNGIAAGMLIYVALRHVNAFDSQAAYLRGEERGEPEGGEWWVTALCMASFVGFSVAIMAVGKWT